MQLEIHINSQDPLSSIFLLEAIEKLSTNWLDKEMKINPPKSSIYWNSHYHYNGPFLSSAINACNPEKEKHLIFKKEG